MGLTEVNQRSAKVTQQRAKVSQESNGVTSEDNLVSQRSRKTERSIEVKSYEFDQVMANSIHSETRSENRSANFVLGSEQNG